MSGTVLILGATSAIARGSAEAFARRGYDLFLAGRDSDELDRDAEDLRIRFQVKVQTGQFDAADYASHPEFLKTVLGSVDELSGVLLAFGYLGEQEKAAGEWSEANRIIQLNYTGAVSITNLCATQLRAQGHGFIAGIASVAGDRGRQSNYIYGSAKGAFALYLQGLRNALFPSGVHVMTIKPGFVDTAMTYGMPGLFLVARPTTVGEAIARAVDKKRNTLYVPWFWWGIMTIIRSIPENLFKRLKL